MMRITHGRNEIKPNNTKLNWQWKNHDQIEIKLKLLGGMRDTWHQDNPSKIRDK